MFFLSDDGYDVGISRSCNTEYMNMNMPVSGFFTVLVVGLLL